MKPKSAFHARVTRVSEDRARWLALNVLPHEPWLRGWLGARAAAGIDIDDVIQESYAHLIELQSVAHIRSPRNYFCQTAKSIVLMQLRRERIVPIEAMARIDQLGTRADDPLPDQQAEARQELREVASAIAALPPKCREVFVLRKVEGLSQRAAAQALGVTESTIEKQLGRGVRRLMDIFGRGGKSSSGASSAQAGKLEVHDQARDERRN